MVNCIRATIHASPIPCSRLWDKILPSSNYFPGVIATGRASTSIRTRSRESTTFARLELQYASGAYQVRGQVRNNASGWSNTSWATISDAPHLLEIDWRAATAAGANDGGLTLWVDEVDKGSFSNIDNDTRRVDQVKWGAVFGIDTGTRGTYYFDAFKSRRSSYIGQANLTAPIVAQGKAGKVQAMLPQVNLPALPGFDTLPAIPAQPAQFVNATITYTYDPLGRLTQATYSDGTYFKYTYDAVGNRLSEETAGVTINAYTYDAANRLASVDGIPYTWDDNGNLLSDGLNTYAYDYANRLLSVSRGAQTVGSYQYNGKGDRIRQTVNGVTTNYTLDLNTGLTQVLTDGTNTYQYGNGRILQDSAAGKAYFLGDALGSVRQLADAGGNVTLSRSYTPFGEVLSSAGGGASVYGYTGEATDNTGMIYLRARYYAPGQGRFMSRDTWAGDENMPMSYNAWLYTYANPINYVDPTGYWRWQRSEPIYHTPIENYYELAPVNPTKQIEFHIPGTLRHPDMFNSLTGDVYEIEPVTNIGAGARQVWGYVADLSRAARGGLLDDWYLGIVPYNWNNTPFHVGTGIDWPGQFRQSPLNLMFPFVDLVADYVGNGVVAYWLEPNANAIVLIGIPLAQWVPNQRIVRPRTWRFEPAYQPAYAIDFGTACGVVLIAVGGAILTFTLLEDATLVGIVDDVVTVPAGLLLVNYGSKLATYSPVP